MTYKKNDLEGTRSEKELINLALSGDQQYFDALLRPHLKYVYNISYGILYNEEDAKDATQETLIKVYKSLNSFKMNANFSTWLYRIAVNSAKDVDKQRKGDIFSLESSLEESGDYILYEQSKKQPSPEDLYERKEMLEIIQQAISELPFNHRELIVLIDIQALSYMEVSEILNKSLGSVKSGINRARKYLSSILISKGIAPSKYSINAERREGDEK